MAGRDEDAEQGEGAFDRTLTAESDEPQPATAGFARWTSDLRRGDHVGRYEIIERLGEGGMGVVYAGRDPTLDRRIAIKFLHESADGSHLSSTRQRRLLREAKTMAQLSHPNVATAYDVGTFHGRVFVAMELIDGVTLRDWLAAEPRSWKEIWSVFEGAGRGLAAAHSAGVVHRDFKPENVMVNRDGRARVTDFGLAASATELAPASDTDDDGDEALDEPRLTRTGAILGTPRYMSPEQHLGRAADERSDQFSFCVALWEAACGSEPFAGANMAELAAAVTSGRLEDSAASRLPRHRREALRRGLRVAPDQRFASMDALLSALARDPTATSRRFALGALLVAGVAGLAVLILPGSRNDAATACAHSADGLTRVWNDQRKASIRESFIATRAPFAGKMAQAFTDRIDQLGRNWTAMRTDNCNSTRVRGEQSDELMDLKMACLDQQLGGLDALANAFSHDVTASMVEKALGAADALPSIDQCADAKQLRALMPLPADPLKRKDIAAARKGLYQLKADRQAGRLSLERATALLETATAIDYPPLTADVMTEQAEQMALVNHFADAIATLERAVQQHARAGDDRGQAQDWIQLTHAALQATSDTKQARTYLEAAKAALARGGIDDKADIYRLEGLVLAVEGRFDDARKKMHQAVEEERKVPSSTPYELLLLRTGEVNATAQAGDMKAAIDQYRSLIADVATELGPDHPMVADLQHNLASILVNVGRTQEAEAIARRSLETRLRTRARDSSAVGDALVMMGKVEYRQGKLQDALDDFERARPIVEKSWGKDQPDYADLLQFKANVLAKLGRDDEADQLYAESLDIYSKALGPKHPQVGLALNNIGDQYIQAKKWDKARSYIQRSYDVFRNSLGEDHPVLLASFAELAQISIGAGDLSAARKWIAKGRALAARAAVDPEILLTLDFLAATERVESGRDPKGGLEQARKIRDEAASHPGMTDNLSEMDDWLAKHGQR